MKESFDNKIFLATVSIFFTASIITAFLGAYIDICRILYGIGICGVSYLIFKEYSLKSCSSFNKIIRVIFIVMLFLSTLVLFSGTQGSNFPIDIAAMGFMLFGWRWYTIKQKYLLILFSIIFILSAFCFIYTKQWANLALVANYDKGLGHAIWYTYTYMLCFATFVVPVSLFIDINGNFEKFKWVIYASVIFAALICLITQKRAVFVDTILLILYLFIFRVKKINASYIISICICIIIGNYLLKAIGVDILSTLFDNLMNRFESTSDDMDNFDRYVEFKKWAATVTPLGFVFGEGIGSWQNVLGFDNYHLHIGWFNLIFKGGLLLALTVFIGMISNMIKACKSKFEHKRAIIFLCVLVMIHLLHSTMWGYSIDAMTLSMALYSSNKLKNYA